MNAETFTGNFLNMLFKTTELKYEPDPILEKALEVLFILHVDHEQNCSANAMRSVGSSHTDPFSALAAAAAALYGPLHGGANEAVLRMLHQIGSKDKVSEFIKSVKSGEGGRLMGFGHRVYKSYDPRARIIKGLADEVFEVTGKTLFWRLPWSWRRSLSRTTTSSPATFTLTSTSTPGSSTRPWGFRWRCSPCSSRSLVPRAGWRNGRKCCSIPTRESHPPAGSYG